MNDTFILTIALGNDAMESPADVSNALRDVAGKLGSYGEWDGRPGQDDGKVRDLNGNTVGAWTLADPPKSKRPDVFDLEAYLDRSTLRDVLEQLAAICDGKAAHIAENWQDEPLARIWHRAGYRISKAAGTAEVKDVS